MPKTDIAITVGTFVAGLIGIPVAQNEAMEILASCLVGAAIGCGAGSLVTVTAKKTRAKEEDEFRIRVRKRHVVNFLCGVGLGPFITAWMAVQLPDYIPHFATAIAVSFTVGMLAVLLFCVAAPALASRSKIVCLIRLLLKKTKPSRLP